MPKAKKLPSGNWRVQVLDKKINGKNKMKSFTAKTKKEAEYLAAEWKRNKNDEKEQTPSLTLRQAIDKYTELKKSVLSPSTLLNYKKYNNVIPEYLIDTLLDDITKYQIDKFISEYSDGHAPKTVTNVYNFINTVCKYFNKDIGKHELPQKIPVKYIVPTDEEVRKLLDGAQDNEDRDLYIGLLLGAYGCMRRSEICGASTNDLSGDTLHIHNAIVQGADRKYHDKTTKTVSSDRYIELPQFLIDELPTEGKFVNVTPAALTRRFERLRDDKNMRKFRFHDLRHYCASVMHAKGIPDSYIMEYGGWSNDRVLKQVYRNVLDDYKQDFTEKRKKIFEELIKKEDA